MLLVILHNDKEYLNEAMSIMHDEGVTNASICEEEGLVKSLHGRENPFFPVQQPDMLNEFNYALIAAVSGKDEAERLEKQLQSKQHFYLSTKDELMFTIPYNNIEQLFRKSRGEDEVIDFADLIIEERVCLDLSAADKAGVIKEMIELLGDHEHITDKEALLEGLQAREELETTGIGDGLALPHARTDIVKELMVAFGRSEKGVDFESLDGKPVHFVFLIVAPKKDSSKVLRLLAWICRIMTNEFRQALLAAASKQEVMKMMEEKAEMQA